MHVDIFFIKTYKMLNDIYDILMSQHILVRSILIRHSKKLSQLFKNGYFKINYLKL